MLRKEGYLLPYVRVQVRLGLPSGLAHGRHNPEVPGSIPGPPEIPPVEGSADSGLGQHTFWSSRNGSTGECVSPFPQGLFPLPKTHAPMRGSACMSPFPQGLLLPPKTRPGVVSTAKMRF